MNDSRQSFWTALILMMCATLIAQPAIAENTTFSEPARKPVTTVTGSAGVVVSDSIYASRIGVQIMDKGGNAVDAAVAVAFALAVTWPEAGNIAGGGFMMVAEPGKPDVWCVDYREKAPAAATPTMFVNERSRFILKQVGVPGTIAGLAQAHERWGRLPWRDLVMPAAELAKAGFIIDEHLAYSLNTILAKKHIQKDAFAEFRKVYGKPGGGIWQAGDHIAFPDLAGTLRRIADGGPQEFYCGWVSGQLVAEMQRHDGIITQQDLTDYQAIIRRAIDCDFDGYRVYGPPPPSAGGFTLSMMLHEIQALPMSKYERFSAPALHLMAEAMRRAYHQRAIYLGDTDYVSVPDFLNDPAFGAKLAASIDPDKATPSERLSPDIPLAGESLDTTHFSIVDADGMAVSNTYTLEMSWGTGLIPPGTGMILNNEMGDFNPEPGHTDRQGHIGTPPNVIAPGKRMLSSQTPVIVKRDGKVVLVVGSPGGRTITNTVFNVLVSTLVYHMPLAEAVDGPRIHHQWFPDQIQFEEANNPAYADVVEQLRKLGQVVISKGRQGSAHCISIDPATGMRTGVVDWRRGGGGAVQQSVMHSK